METAQASGEASTKRGYVDGCFDIMHSGHYNAIRQAKSISDVLVVGIHSDEEIESNKALPVMKQAERYALLEHIKWVDEILHDVPYSPEMATLERARADFCVHGDDMPVNAQGIGAYDEMRIAGKLRIVRRTEGVSTTDLIGRLLTLSRQHHVPPALESPKGGIRVMADEAIEKIYGGDLESLELPESSLALPSELPARKVSEVSNSGEGSDIAAALAAKYKMSPEDTELLRKSMAQPIPAIPSGVPASPQGLRAKAPVQLLASTRRLVEFASSRLPTETDRVVYVSGSFDMFHVGHAQFLKEARALGTFLLVGIHEDSTVRHYKGASFPVMTLTERVLNVCACKWVDEVIIGAPRSVTEDLIKSWDIHVVARGTKHMRSTPFVAGLDDNHKIPKDANIFVEVPSKWPELCHDTVVERIMTSRQAFIKRNSDRAQREDAYYQQKSQADPREK